MSSVARVERALDHLFDVLHRLRDAEWVKSRFDGAESAVSWECFEPEPGVTRPMMLLRRVERLDCLIGRGVRAMGSGSAKGSVGRGADDAAACSCGGRSEGVRFGLDGK